MPTSVHHGPVGQGFCTSCHRPTKSPPEKPALSIQLRG
ncbi:MAG: hypothetical protein EBW49_07635 [Betaproteobacteria bacterium]|nr:hypothetical protein [Betaproteobacteria bacterium]NDG15346.1 hypothetical protein [Betaproteobacteria bacterium]